MEKDLREELASFRTQTNNINFSFQSSTWKLYFPYKNTMLIQDVIAHRGSHLKVGAVGIIASHTGCLSY